MSSNNENSNNNLINLNNNNNNSNNNNNNRYIGDIDMSCKDQIIQELANELEQSAIKLDKINDEIEKEKNEINNNESNHFRTNSLGMKKTSYVNVFDLKKNQREIEKKINNLDKRLLDLDKFTKNKLVELINQLDLSNHNPINHTYNLVKQNLYHTTYNANGMNKNNQVIYDKLIMNNPPSIIELGQNFIGNFPNNNYNANVIKNRQIVQLKGNARKPTVRTISNKAEKIVDDIMAYYNNDDNKMANGEIKFIRKLERRSTIDANQFNNNKNDSINERSKKTVSLNKVLNRPVTHN